MPKLKPRPCNRCGKKLTWETWVHSSWNEAYYCRDLDGCGKRAAARKKKEEKEAA